MKRRPLPDLRNARAGIEPKRLTKTDAAAKPLGLKITNAGASDPTTTELWIYDEIGLFWGISSQDIADALAEVTTPNLRVRINSPGGDVFEGIAIMNLLASWNGTVTGVVDALCASIATVIAMACETVTMSPGSQMMIHPASGFCGGDQADMLQMAALLGFQTNNIAGLYAARAGGDQAGWLALMAAETWLTADEAVTAGLADATGVVKQSGVIAIPAAEPDYDDMWDLSVYRFAGRANAPAPTAVSGTTVKPRPAVAPVPDLPEEPAEPTPAEPATPAPPPEPAGPADPPDTTPLGPIEWNFITHPDETVSGTCDECDGYATGGPYLVDDFPDIPVHPNCVCSMEFAGLGTGDAELPLAAHLTVDPFTAHFLTASAAIPAEADEAELARQWREAFV